MDGKATITSRNPKARALALLITTVVGFSLCSSAYAWSYKEAAAPYKGTTTLVIDDREVVISPAIAANVWVEPQN